jgi:hypothetical protein
MIAINSHDISRELFSDEIVVSSPLSNEPITPHAVRVRSGGYHNHVDISLVAMSTPRAIKYSPDGVINDSDLGTPTEPSAPLKEKCKSDPRKNDSSGNSFLSQPNAKHLQFEDDRTLVSLQTKKHRKKDSTGLSRNKGNVAWGDNSFHDADISKVIAFMLFFFFSIKNIL